LTFIVVRALAGRLAKKIRQVFEAFVNGLNLVVTSVMCFVIILQKQFVAKWRVGYFQSTSKSKPARLGGIRPQTVSVTFADSPGSKASFFSLAMSAQALNARLTSLFESLKQTQNLITRLSKLPTQPGSSPSNPEEGDARVELSAEIHQSLKEQEEDFDLLRQGVEDQTNSVDWSSSARPRGSGRDRERTDLASQITRLGEDLKMYDDSICFLEAHI